MYIVVFDKSDPLGNNKPYFYTNVRDGVFDCTLYGGTIIFKSGDVWCYRYIAKTELIAV